MNEIITLAIIFTARVDKVSELRDALVALVEPTLKEPGCLNYELSQLEENKEQFIMYEKWENQGYLERHLQQKHVVEFKNKMEALLFELPEVKLARPLESSKKEGARMV